MSTTSTPQTQAKAIVAGILAVLFAGISALGTVVTGTQTLADVTTAQWLFVIGAMISAGGSSYGITWAVTNAPSKDLPALVSYSVPPAAAAAPVVTRSFDEIVPDQSSTAQAAAADLAAHNEATATPRADL